MTQIISNRTGREKIIKAKKNDRILLVGIGGGLSWGITLIKKT